MQALIGLPEIESQIIIQEMILLNFAPYPLRTARNQLIGESRKGYTNLRRNLKWNY